MAIWVRPPWVLTLARSLLAALPGKDRGVNIEGKATCRLSQQTEQPDPEWTPERLDSCLSKLMKKSSNCVFAWKAPETQHRMQGLVIAKPPGIDKPAGPRQHRVQECRQCVLQGNRIGRPVRKWHRCRNPFHIADGSQQCEKGCHASKRRHRLRQRAGQTCAYRFVLLPRCWFFFTFHPNRASSRTASCFFQISRHPGRRKNRPIVLPPRVD